MMQQYDEVLNVKQLDKMQQGMDYDAAIWRGLSVKQLYKNTARHRLWSVMLQSDEGLSLKQLDKNAAGHRLWCKNLT